MNRLMISAAARIGLSLTCKDIDGGDSSGGGGWWWWLWWRRRREEEEEYTHQYVTTHQSLYLYTIPPPTPTTTTCALFPNRVGLFSGRRVSIQKNRRRRLRAVIPT